MPFPFLPAMVAGSVTDLTPEMLQEKNIRLLMLDFDNTIVPYTTNVPTGEMTAWLENMQKSDIVLCVVSNSHNDRVRIFCEKYGLNCITHAKKPFPKGIRQCLKQFGIPAEYCALAGDQIYTDTLGANSAGIRAILVRPIHNHNIWLKLRHIVEQPFILAAKNRRIEK